MIKQLFFTLKNRCIYFLLALITCSVFAGAFYYFIRPVTYYAAVPVKITESNLPYLDVMIDGDTCPLVIDLGSRLQMKIHSPILEKFNKISHGKEKWRNFRGTIFEYPTYILPKIQVGSLTFTKPIVVDVPLSEHKKYIIWQDPEKEIQHPKAVGYLGRGLLKKVNLLLDMNHSQVVFANDLNKLREEGYEIESFTKIPFILDPKGMIIEIQTDLGKLKFSLDTGCTWTILHDFLYPKNIEKKVDFRGFPTFTSKTFTIGGTEFGNQQFYFLEMTEKLYDVDGLLGMDFIKEHVMYIDFSKRVIYIKPPHKS